MPTVLLNVWSPGERSDGRGEYAVVTLDDTILPQLLGRLQAFEQLRAQDPALVKLTFWDGTPDFIESCPAIEPYDARLNSEECFKLAELPDGWDEQLEAVDGLQQVVEADGLHWTAILTHDDIRLTTATMARETLLNPCQPEDQESVP